MDAKTRNRLIALHGVMLGSDQIGERENARNIADREPSYPTMFTRANVGFPAFRSARGINHSRSRQYCLPRWRPGSGRRRL